MTDAGVCLNIGAWQERSSANGPGYRTVVWVQGCGLNCPGCFSPEFQPFVPRRLLTVDQAVESVLGASDIEGVTFTGGEPTSQARGVALFAERLRAHGLTIVCYTGHTLAALRASDNPWIGRLISATDVLIDGPYRCQEAAVLLWRGSRNQRVHFLTDAYRDWADKIDDAPAEVELLVAHEGFTSTGIWPAGFLETLNELLGR